ncbi:MAG: SPOR domain-containing protein [Gammaproteobacteria bacterium]|nr:SPOR domain-containing protein [Gammaproteobacteria bacterium]
MMDYNDQPLHRIDPGYLEQFGLREAPFTAVVDDRFYFSTPEASQRMNLLVHMTQYSDMVLMVLGDEGMGKTSLLQNYVKSAHSNWHICRINANTMMDKDQLLFRIAEDFGLESLPANSAELQEMLYDKMIQLHQNDVLPVIIVDDAHELSVDAISQLFIMAEIKAGDVTMVHIVLFAESLIEKTINASNVRKIRERIGHTFELEPFDDIETADYIQSRLTLAGLEGENPFSPKVIHQIHKQSHGNPARINELAHIALDEANNEAEPEFPDYDDDEFEIKADRFLTPSLLFIFLSIFTIAGLGYWKQDEINQFFTGTGESTLELAMQDTTATEPDEEQPSPFAKLKEKMFKLGGIKPDASVQPKPVKDKPAEPINLERIEDPALAEQLAVAQQAVPTPVIERIEPAELFTSSKKQTITLHGKNFSPDTKVILSWSDNEITLPRSRLQLSGDKKIRFRFNTGNKADNWNIVVKNPGSEQTHSFNLKVAAAKPKPEFNPKNLTAEKWVSNQAPTNLTLQLLGSYVLNPIHQYIKQHRLSDKTVIYKTQRENRDWYVLFYGSYKSTQQAMQAIQSLPVAAKTQRPWMRTFASIQTQKKQRAAQTQISNTIRGKNTPDLQNIEAHQAWLWSQNPGNYTLQLLGTQNIDKLKSFIQQHRLRGKVVYYHTRKNNQDWYALVYGVYPKTTDARSAVKELPSSLKNLSPWVRNFSAIHAEMDKGQQ